MEDKLRQGQEELEAWRATLYTCMGILKGVKRETKDKGSKHVTHEMLRNLKAGIELRLPLCWLSFLILESARLVAGGEKASTLLTSYDLYEPPHLLGKTDPLL